MLSDTSTYILKNICGGICIIMLNYLWGGMILVGIIFGVMNGKLPDITEAALESSKEAVALCITMLGVLSLWMGLMEIATKAGIIRYLSKKIQPVIRFLFPEIPKGHVANEYISTNMIANFLGLGWAATPAGLKAMESLAELNGHNKAASNSMCTFLVINISSLQLIPINVIAYRSQYGSVNPTIIVGAAIMATMVSTLAGVVFCKVMCEKGRRT